MLKELHSYSHFQEGKMSFDTISALSTVIAVIAIGFSLFLLLRRLTLWYFRINEIAGHLAVIAEHYKRQSIAPRQQPDPQPMRRTFAP
jgi:hypothetical protein